ncbi:MAG: ABC transporter ATP-binding protein [Lachnospiraceae bacterium]|nr:ABC transporter ATP-binding protein [Lachnospiraceae bacterium]
MGRIRKIVSYLVQKENIKELWHRVLWIAGYGKLHWKAMILYTLLGIMGTILSLVGSLVSKSLVDIITGHETGQVIWTFCVMIGMNLGSTFITQISGYVSTRINLKVDADIKADIFEKILETDWESLDQYHTGDLLSRWGSDASNIASGVLNFIPNFIIYLFRFTGALIMVVHYDASFAAIALLGMPVTLFFSRRLTARMQKTNMRSSVMNAKMSGFNQEAFSNVQTIKAFDMIHLYTQRLQELQKEYISMRMNYQKISILIFLVMTFIGMCVSYASYGWGIFRVWSGAISYGTMTMFLSLSATLTGTLNSLLSLVPTAISLTTSASRLMDIVELPREDFGQKAAVKELYQAHAADGLGISVEDVTYAYLNGNQVFDGVSLEAHPHEVVALVGPSGEGKTTMLRLLLALVLPQGGQVRVVAGEGGQDMQLSASVRQLISYVPQGNTMFSGTIAENMRNVKEDATDEEIIEALKTACAWKFVQKLPDGINSEIKERGGGFSEGQAQRLSIARAILRQSPILLLDEATSALDAATEKQVLQNIMQDRYPRTCIVTTHRPTVLKVCTRVYQIGEQKCRILEKKEIEELTG